ncbi:alpha/beta fold hydrolase [Paenibacillus sp. CECT 9249]|uniref:alpha/beta fold hydrolase n=1 Tax=unclassified Paenibacillus TaxID=185978 RepID=UPI001C11A0C8|nr:alpha/beta hydrolase [Paenibacillus sp. CECT 9249]MBU5443419.1 alpha/beta hydrolase [Paenibacillus sp. MSJ-34]CAH0122452.1 hypothetical protein PAE9249_05003 [Paenibacillus sp. CECT 9249]
MFKRMTVGHTPAIRNRQGDGVSSGVALMEQMNAGGLKQWVVIRGHHTGNPLLLFLHGGPGASMTGALRKYNAELEQAYTVVSWDYRGAGKNYDPSIAPETMNIGQLVSDARDIVMQLLDRFDQQKCFVAGASFGAVVGMRFVQAFPDLVHAYIGVNQPPAPRRRNGFPMSLHWKRPAKQRMAKPSGNWSGLAPPNKAFTATRKTLLSSGNG